jgi:hypothetical protein
VAQRPPLNGLLASLDRIRTNGPSQDPGIVPFTACGLLLNSWSWILSTFYNTVSAPPEVWLATTPVCSTTSGQAARGTSPSTSAATRFATTIFVPLVPPLFRSARATSGSSRKATGSQLLYCTYCEHRTVVTVRLLATVWVTSLVGECSSP